MRVRCDGSGPGLCRMLGVAVAVSQLYTTCACINRCLLSCLCGLCFHFPYRIIKYDCWTTCCRSWKRASTMACSARLSTARLANSLTRSVASETIRSADPLGTWRYVVHWRSSVGCPQYTMWHYLTHFLSAHSVYLLDVTCICEPKESISSTFFEYREWKPTVDCSMLNWMHGPWLRARWSSSKHCTACHHVQWPEWSSDVSCQIK